jgi:hypothetical protein
MQSYLPLLVSAALVGSAAAQVNPFVFYPQDPERQTLTCTSYVGRPDMSNAAEALMEINDDHFRGVGDANGIIRLFGVYHWLADEKLSTIETYGIVVRNFNPAGGPDMSVAGEFLRINGLTSPPSTNPNRGTWLMYDGFNIAGGLIIFPPPGSVAFAPERFYVGVDLPANPLWPATDGHSLFRADMIGANTPATLGENEKVGSPHPTWAGLQGAPSFTTPWTYVLGPFVTSPNLHIGGVDPLSTRLGTTGANIGMNGLFPDVSGTPRRDGLIIRVTDNLAPFGIVGLGASIGFQPPYFIWELMGTLIGNSHVGDPLTIVPLAVSGLQAGVREFTIALPNTLSPTLVGNDFAFQAIVWDVNLDLAEWTNAQVVHL